MYNNLFLVNFSFGNVVIFVFLILIFVSFYQYSKKDNKNEHLIKIIGGFAVFIVAIIAHNVWVYGLSLFIGGLIIASEDFMKFLIAVTRTSGNRVADTLKVLMQPANQKEIDTKIEEEIESNVKNEQEISNEIISSSRNIRLEEAKQVENKLQDIFKKAYGNFYKSYVNLTTSKGRLIADGVTYDNFNKIKEIFEFKYIGIGGAKNFRNTAKKFLERIENIGLRNEADICLGIFGTSEKAARVIPHKIFDILSCQRPCITRDSPALRELVVDNDAIRLIPAGDAHALAEAIMQFYHQRHHTVEPSLFPSVGNEVIGRQFSTLLAKLLG